MPAISSARAANVATYAWTKLYAGIMNSISGIYMNAVNAWPFITSTTIHTKFVPPVSDLLLMVGGSTNQN